MKQQNQALRLNEPELFMKERNMKMEINNLYVEAASLCTPSKLPASDYVINPYVGCSHRCAYCYASFMSRFNGHNGEKWGSYLQPKKYKSLKLPRNLAGKTVLIGSVTDAYNPAEKKFSLMPEILKVLVLSNAHVEILTKSSLVVRDIELLKNIPDLAVGISLSNLNDEDNKYIEPGASSAKDRIKALKVLHEAGIKTYVFVAPYLPGITELGAIYEATKDCVDMLCVENLNLRGNKEEFINLVKTLHPELEELYRRIYLGGYFGEYWNKVELEIAKLKERANIDIVSYMYHEKIKKGHK